jgi:L-malate glycosyltransferase
MKILISISNLMIGGAQTFVIRLATGLSEHHCVYVYNLSPELNETTLATRFPPQIKIAYLPLPLNYLARKIDKYLNKLGIKSKLLTKFKAWHFQYILHKLNIDVINSHLYHSDDFIVFEVNRQNIPLAITDHGDYRYVLREQLADKNRIIEIFERVNGIVYVSDSNAASLAPWIANSSAIKHKIYYGVPQPIVKGNTTIEKQNLKISPQALVFGMVARGIAEKGWTEAIEAFINAKNITNKEIHLILVGASNYLDTIRESLSAELLTSIHFVGYSSSPELWIECFDVGLLPTYFPGESLPNSIIEYLALSKPVVATDIGGIAEMISYQEQKAGFLVELSQAGKADISLLTNAMLTYINDPRLLAKQANLAEQAFEKFKIQNCLESYEKLFERAIALASQKS